MSNKTRYFQLSQDGMSWTYVDDKDVADLMGNGADIRTDDDLIAIGVIASNGNDIKHASFCWSPDQIALQVADLEHTHAKRLKKKQSPKGWFGGRHCEHAYRQFIANHPELQWESSYWGVRIKNPSPTTFTLAAHVSTLKRALQDQCGVWFDRWSMLWPRFRRDDMYDDIVNCVIMLQDVRERANKKAKDACRAILKMLPTHDWKDKKHVGVTELGPICKALISGKKWEETVVKNEKKEDS